MNQQELTVLAEVTVPCVKASRALKPLLMQVKATYYATMTCFPRNIYEERLDDSYDANERL